MSIKLYMKRLSCYLGTLSVLSLAASTLIVSPLYGQSSRESFTLGQGIPGRLVERVPLSKFPHWLHSLWYTCKACHDSVFPMEKIVSGLVMDTMAKGELCGVCHDDEISFGIKNNCGRCHQSRDTKRSLLFPGPQVVSIDDLDKVFKKLGVKWFPQKLKNRALILDVTGQVDFERMMLSDKVILPKGFIDKPVEEKVRDNLIVFSPKSDFMGTVLFDHTVHSRLISCRSCHEKIFLSSLNGNNVLMKDIAGGKYCGTCHNGIAFSVDNCKKCHGKNANQMSRSPLIRK